MAEAESAAHSELRDKVVVVTGASSGIGRGVAQAFARTGAKVVMAARRSDVLEQLEREFEEAGYTGLAVATDVGQADEVEHLADRAINRFGHIDIWLNDAGVGVVGRFDEVPLRDHEQLIRTNLIGTLNGSYFALRHFRERDRGVLINIASIFGKMPSLYWASYCASKFGIVGLSDSLRQELRREQVRNVRVCTVLPMTTDTPFFEHAANYSGHEIPKPPPVFEAEQVVEVILRLAQQPEDEVIVGNSGRVMNAAHQLAPEVMENFFGMQAQRMFDRNPPADDTDGAVLQPMTSGAQVSGGILRAQ